MMWTRGTLADFMGDCVVYRNLEPMTPDLPGLHEAWARAGLDHYYVPRKTDPEYAATLVYFLREAQAARQAGTIKQAFFIGDTLMLDGTAARNIGQHIPLAGFIGSEKMNQPAQTEFQGELMVSNRWRALADFVDWTRRAGLPCDEHTVLLLDLDKTSLGARGRNDKVIDKARVQAILSTMRAALGDGLEEAAFRAVYDPLNVPAYHPFTADNQDYLAYVTLMALGNVYPLESLWADLKSGELTQFGQFVERCEARRGAMSAGLLAAHEEVRAGMAAQDPTPFKGFRRREYQETVGRMDLLPSDAPEEVVLAGEIVITAEVASLARYMASQGALVFGISDKPDEASIPPAELAAQGYRCLHRTLMKVYGEVIL